MIAYAPRRLPSIIAGLIALTLAMSIVAAIDARYGGDLYRRLALSPRDVWHGEVWRLVTFPFVHLAPLPLICTCLTLYACGWDLATAWGGARFGRFFAAIVVLAGVGTSLIALVWSAAWWTLHGSGLIVFNALAIAWASQFPERRVSVYLVLVLGGRSLVVGALGLTLLLAAFYGVARMLPELLACAGALAYTAGAGPRWWRTFRARRKLGVIRGERHGGPYGPN